MQAATALATYNATRSLMFAQIQMSVDRIERGREAKTRRQAPANHYASK